MLTETQQTALKLLARREHSTYELEQKLLQKGHILADIEAVIVQLQQQRLLSDERYAEMFIRSRIGRGYGLNHIKAELNKQQVDLAIIDKFLPSKAEWQVKIEDVRIKRFGKALPKDFKELARQARFLQYRGFTSDQINYALKNHDYEI